MVGRLADAKSGRTWAALLQPGPAHHQKIARRPDIRCIAGAESRISTAFYWRVSTTLATRDTSNSLTDGRHDVEKRLGGAGRPHLQPRRWRAGEHVLMPSAKPTHIICTASR